MVPVSSLPRDACDAFAANRIEAVLHYSRRSARAFLEAARAAGVEISALAMPQCCISDAVASIVRDAGATQVMVAAFAGRKCLIRGAGPCFARLIALQGAFEAGTVSSSNSFDVRSGINVRNRRDGR